MMNEASSSDASMTQTCPLALLAQTCSKIKPDSAGGSKPSTVKRSVPVKIAPAPSQKIIALKPGIIVAPTPKVVMNLLLKDIENQIQNNPKAILTVPLNALKSQNMIVQSQQVFSGVFDDKSGLNAMSALDQIGIQQNQLAASVPGFASLKTLPQSTRVIVDTEKNIFSNVVTPTALTSQQILSAMKVVSTTSYSNGGLADPNFVLPDTSLKTEVKVPVLPETVFHPGLAERNFAVANNGSQNFVQSLIQSENFNPQMPQKLPISQLHDDGLSPQVSHHLEVQTQQTPRSMQNASVQITVPPNTSLSGLQQILQLAANAAKQYQSKGQRDTVVIRGELNGKNEFPENVVERTKNAETHSEWSKSRKMRSHCTCPNCVKRNSTVNAVGEIRKRVHVCSFPNCNKEFSKTSHLKSHIRTHTGERPYVCNVPFCDRKFTRSDELLRHLRTHSGLKKFECPYCEKKFTRSDHLKKHKKVHFK